MRLLLAIVAAFALLAAGQAQAASTTPPNLNVVTSIASGDLELTWPVGSTGPLSAISWSSLKAQLVTDLGGTSFLMVSNNLSDLASPTTARTNLGAASTGANTFTGKQTLPASTTSAASLNIAPGSAPSSPSNGDIWTTSSGAFARINGATVGLFGCTGSCNFTGSNQLGASSTDVQTVEGHLVATGATPTGTCNSISGNDIRGTAAFPSNNSCTVLFAHSFSTTPVCVGIGGSLTNFTSISSGGFTANAASSNTQTFQFICIG